MMTFRKNIYRLMVAVVCVAPHLHPAPWKRRLPNRGEGNLTITTDIKGDVTKHTRAIGEDEHFSPPREVRGVYRERQGDLDILTELAKDNLIGVNISITSLSEKTRMLVEPRTATIKKRIETVKLLSETAFL